MENDPGALTSVMYASWFRLNVADEDRMMAKSTEGSQLIDAKIASLEDWRGDLLARVRAIIRDADPEVDETVKWRKVSNPTGVPVWEHAGIICTGEIYRDKVKLTFARGASLDDPSSLFNSSLDGGTRRAIDICQGAKLNEPALKALIHQAVVANLATKKATG